MNTQTIIKNYIKAMMNVNVIEKRYEEIKKN